MSGYAGITVQGAIAGGTSAGAAVAQSITLDAAQSIGYYMGAPGALVIDSGVPFAAAGQLIAFFAMRRGPGDVPFTLGMATLEGTSTGTIADLQLHGVVSVDVGAGDFMNLACYSAIVATPGNILLSIDNGLADDIGGGWDVFDSATGWDAARAAAFASATGAAGDPTLGNITPATLAAVHAIAQSGTNASAFSVAGDLVFTGAGAAAADKFVCGYAITPGAAVATSWTSTVSTFWNAAAVSFVPV